MKTYSGRNLDLIAYPMGGIGAGMVCLQGTGRLGNISVRHKPDYHNDPVVFSAVTVLGESPVCRVVEAPVPDTRFFARLKDSGNGLSGTNLGLPRFSEGSFSERFPFATVRLRDAQLPLEVALVGWSPFTPGDEDSSSLPVAALEYTFTNTAAWPVDAVYYFCSMNFMKKDDCARVRPLASGFVLEQPAIQGEPAAKGAFCASVDDEAFVDAAWFRGGWFDTLSMLWNAISAGQCVSRRLPAGEPASPGGTLAVPFHLQPGESRTIHVRLSWHVGASELRIGGEDPCCGEDCACHSAPQTYRPWYASRYASVDEVDADWRDRYAALRAQTLRFTDCFYDTTLPEDIVDAVAANLCILKSPTVLRQQDGRLWGWEGCCDDVGCCHGSCTHVWNYAQALCHLFPRLERSLRETEFRLAQDERGHQNFRASLPIRPSADHGFHAASDGQLGGVMKVYREWRISGDTAWMAGLWPQVRSSLDYCIACWDPDHEGVVREPHHNTYDIEFWGPDGLCSSFYLGALRAAQAMAAALGEDVPLYGQLYERGRAWLEKELYNGEYFFQKVQWQGLRAQLDTESANAETRALLQAEGPKYQYGTGCLSDGVLGAWLADLVGLGDILDGDKLRENLRSIFRYNWKRDLSVHANPQRPGYAAGHDAGLLLCTWPHGGRPSLPFVYSDEVWTGIEYQVASHLLLKGMQEPALQIVRGLRARYDGAVRNPYNEYECGHWYARAMASYALLQGSTGIRYDAVDGTLYIGRRSVDGLRAFLCTATGFGTVTLRDGQVAVGMASGTLDVKKVVRTD